MNTVERAFITPSPPAHVPKGLSSTGQAIARWRTHIAKNLDRNPQNLLSDNELQKLAIQIQKLAIVSPATLLEEIKKINVTNDQEKTARLMFIFVTETNWENKLHEYRCGNCDTYGHPVSLYNSLSVFKQYLYSMKFYQYVLIFRLFSAFFHTIKRVKENGD